MSRPTRLPFALFTLLLSLTLVVACDEKKDAPAATTDAAAASTATTASTASAASTPVGVDFYEEDFEDEAEKSINATNLEAEIAKMEAELK